MKPYTCPTSLRLRCAFALATVAFSPFGSTSIAEVRSPASESAADSSNVAGGSLRAITTALAVGGRLGQSLDGSWEIVADPQDVGVFRAWWKPANYPHLNSSLIRVPGNTYEALPNYNGVSWYAHNVSLGTAPTPGLRTFLRFGAVQYFCRVWVNGREVGSHEGGEAPFEVEVTGLIFAGSNLVILRVENPLGVFRSGQLPIFYDQGGIVDHVSLLQQPPIRITDVYARPDLATGAINLEVTLDNAGPGSSVWLNSVLAERTSRREIDRSRAPAEVPNGISTQKLILKALSPHPWDLDDPFLYTVEVSVAAGGNVDVHRIERLGFRDFRVVGGFFQLNGRRIFLKGCHSNHYDPLLIQGVDRHAKWLKDDAVKLKAAGFNMFRSLSSALLPEQLAAADDVGLLMYSEHGGSWLLRDPKKFAVGVCDILRRDRNSPSLALFGMVNEIDQRSPGVYEVARDSLPLMRSLDEACVFMLSSGRWDRDFATGSASNPGSSKWDVMMGGEGRERVSTGALPDMTDSGDKTIPMGGFIDGAGDAHIYNTHPNSWGFISALRTFAAQSQPVFVSEAGCGSCFDPYAERRNLKEAGASSGALAWSWTNQRIADLEKAWKHYGLNQAYPEIPAMILDSQWEAARERDLLSRAIRANPKISGYSMTSLCDAFGLGEGFWDGFRHWKAGHEAVVAAGWAHTRFCILAGPTPLTVGRPFHLVVALADEDQLPPGSGQVGVHLSDDRGNVIWKTTCPFTLKKKGERPLATLLFDADLSGISLLEGKAHFFAELDGRANLAGAELAVPVFDPALNPHLEGTLTVVGLPGPTRAALNAFGARTRDFTPAVTSDRLVIVCGPQLPQSWNGQSWRSIYTDIARGGHLIVIGPDVLRGKSGPNHYLPISHHGTIQQKNDPAIYPRVLIAKPGLVFDGLPCGLLTAEIYGPLLRGVPYLTGTTDAEQVLAVGFNGSGNGAFDDGPIIATWRLGAGRITVCTLGLTEQTGTPVSDRILINLVRYAQSTAPALVPAPADISAQLDGLGIAL